MSNDHNFYSVKILEDKYEELLLIQKDIVKSLDSIDDQLAKLREDKTYHEEQLTKVNQQVHRLYSDITTLIEAKE